MPLTTLEKVKIVLGIPEAVTNIDDILQAMTDAANAEILQYLCLDQADVKLYQVVTINSPVPTDFLPIRNTLLSWM